jgi:maltose phosphorylase
MQWKGTDLHLEPSIPDNWSKYSFHLRFRGAVIELVVGKESATLRHLSGKDVDIHVYGERLQLSEGHEREVNRA